MALLIAGGITKLTMYEDLDNMTRLFMYAIPCGFVIAIFYSIANRVELMISIEETNRVNNLILRAIFEKLDEMEEARSDLQ